MLFGLILMAATAAADVPTTEQPTVDAMQADLQTAYSCKDIDGRKVWKGGLAYYIQSFMYDGQQVTGETDMATDAVLPEDNSPETIREFEEACLTMAPSAQAGN